MNRKSQESIGFMIVIGAAILLFIVFTGLIQENNQTASTITTLTKARTINEKLARAINQAYMLGPGTQINVSLEETEDEYLINILPGTVVIEHSLGFNTNPTSARNVIVTNVTNGLVIIKNEEGIINVTQ